MMRPAAATDRPAIEAFLLQHAEAAMFPLSNLRAHGLGEGDFASDHPHALRVWMADGGPSGVVALTRGGMLLPMLTALADRAALRLALAGLPITGAVGPADQVRALLAFLGLADRPTLRSADEPGFALQLDRLLIPPVLDAMLIPPGPDLRPLLVGWRADYHRETLGTPENQATDRAGNDIDSWMVAGHHRVLLRSGVPVAMTGFNAALPEIVQIGGVYVPPDLRCRGHARLAVALHLAEARALGVRRAVLFAASGAAARAYRAIGFQPTPPVALVLFDSPQFVGPQSVQP